MNICRTIAEFRALRGEYLSRSEVVALVPTMGFLHEAHASLMKIGRENADRVVVSIFVNPSQFNQAADLESYPRDEERDFALLRKEGVDAVFCPAAPEMYPEGFQSWVSVEEISRPWEGAGRPGHFRGVATVCSMLFNLVQPDVAVFGEKDFQQLRLIQQMVEDLKIPTRIMPGPLVRESDGLAMSSRNVRLSPSGREKALHISQSLFAVKERFLQGERKSELLVTSAKERLNSLPGVTANYLSIVNEKDLSECIEIVPEDGARIIATVTVDGVRLLDNLELEDRSRGV